MEVRKDSGRMNYNSDIYEVIKEEHLADIDSNGILLKHKKSGARLVVLSNDDENKVFSIGFRTPPYNDTGLQHIIEHTVLCGSKKYPVKDPFVELCKGSLNTFLNAMTYPDKTVYPVASCNDVDFKNIIDVYMDAVFYPAIYERPEIFMQEGWHYEMDSKDSPLEYNGVVYNEMKGAYSSPDEVLSRYTFTSLFPDTCYSKESGGDPEKIPELSREEFLAYHKEYYHPANSYIYLYGDMDVQERLEYLDKEYLCKFDKKDVMDLNTEILLQKPLPEIATLVKPYAITEDEDEEDNAYLSFNAVVGTTLDEKLYLAMQILDYALIVAPGAVLKQRLIDKGIGTDIYSSYESSLRQPVYSIVAKNANESQQQKFMDTIREVLEELVKNGIDKRTLLAGINYYEFKFREADFGAFPKGLMYGLQLMDSWLYDENEPFIHLEAGKTFDWLKEAVDTDYFTNLIQNQLIDNKHESVVVLVPERNLTEKKEQLTEEKLQKIKASMSEEEIDNVVNTTNKLKEYQEIPSTQEELETIPLLSVSDIKKETQPLYIDKKNIAGTDVIHHNMFTNQIAYILMDFDAKYVPEDLIPYTGLLASLLGFMDTEKYSYAELATEININCGGISTSSAIYTDSVDLNKYTMMYEVKAKVLYSKVEFAFEMFHEILFKTKFDDYKRLKEIIARIKSRLESAMTSSGHSVAMLQGMSQFSATSYYANLTRGYAYYEFINKINNEFDSSKEKIVANIRKLCNCLFNKDNLIISYTADDNGYAKLAGPLEAFISGLKNSELKPVNREYVSIHKNTGYTTSAQVQYVARCGNYVNAGYEYTGALKVLKIIFSYAYLWENVRVKNGAYGCMSGFYKNGDGYFVSYRDPKLAETNEIYEKAADYVANFDASDRDMTKFIIGTIGDMDTPMNPSAKGSRSFGAYLCNGTIEQLQKERDEVLNANQQKIRELAPIVDAVVSQNYFCVVGNAKKISDESKLFDEIKNLI